MPAPTKRTQVHRHPERGDYDRATIDAILDEALICHVAFNDGDGAPRCLPTIHARVGDTIYLHGSTAARAWKALRAGAEVCIAATIVDGLVMARSAFNHSMNYRSVVVFGTAREVTDEDELHTAAAAITSHVAPGREDEARMPTAAEYKQTLLLAVPIEEASAKVRTGPPKDDEEDMELSIWAGVLPLHTRPGEPEPDPRAQRGPRRSSLRLRVPPTRRAVSSSVETGSTAPRQLPGDAAHRVDPVRGHVRAPARELRLPVPRAVPHGERPLGDRGRSGDHRLRDRGDARAVLRRPADGSDRAPERDRDLDDHLGRRWSCSSSRHDRFPRCSRSSSSTRSSPSSIAPPPAR